MKYRFFSLLLFLLTTFPLQLGVAQTSNDGESLLARLLDLPAPGPPPIKEFADQLAAFERKVKASASQVAEKTEPAETASDDEILEYWQKQARQDSAKQPSEKVKKRLLEMVWQPPRLHTDLVKYLTKTDADYARLYDFIEQPIAAELTKKEREATQSTKDYLKTWLMRRSQYYRADLLRAAQQVKYRDRFLENESALKALAGHDWAAARPLLENYANHAEPAISAFALRLLYQRALQDGAAQGQLESMRERFKQWILNRQVDSTARMTAYEALMQADWPGRDDWYLSLFALETTLSDDSLSQPIQAEPEKWAPRIAAFINSGTGILHKNAILVLATVALRKPHRAAVLPLVPWLYDERWTAVGDKYTRYRVMEGAAKLQLPEALDGLLAVIKNEKDAYTRKKALEAVRAYRDPALRPKIVGVLREVLKQVNNDYAQIEVAKQLVSYGEFSDSEKLQALEALVAEVAVQTNDSYPEFFRLSAEPKSLQAFIGQMLLEYDGLQVGLFSIKGEGFQYVQAFSPAFAARLIERSQALRSTNPIVAQRLWFIASHLPYPVAYQAIANELLQGAPSFELWRIALRRQAELRMEASASLVQLAKQAGARRGMAAVLLQDDLQATAILRGQDQLAQSALLAWARITRMALPVALVVPLHARQHKLLALAVERYLESEDSAQARAAVQQFHPERVLILGANPQFEPKPQYQEERLAWEQRLIKEAQKNDVEEVFGVLDTYYSDAGGPDRAYLEIRVGRLDATLCRQEKAGRQECRTLQRTELAELRALFENVHFDDLPPAVLPGSGYGGMTREIVRVNRQRARRVYSANLDFIRVPTKTNPYDQLDQFFFRLKETGEYKLRYALADKIKDLQILVADDDHPVLSVIGDGKQIKALVKNGKDYFDPGTWHFVTAAQLGERTEPPAGNSFERFTEAIPEKIRRMGLGWERPSWQLATTDGTVRVRTWNEQYGLWLFREGQEPKFLLKGVSDDSFLICPPGQWLVTRSIGPNKNTLIQRQDLRTGEMFQQEAAEVGRLWGIGPLAGTVLFQPKSEADNNVMFLYTPATAKLEKITGEFAPFDMHQTRPLQAVEGRANEFWAAIPDYKTKGTKIGRYDAARYQFTSLLDLPEMQLKSSQIWVDESQKQLYFVYQGHLLKMPWRPTVDVTR